MDSPTTRGNSYGADVLRGVAILMVVVYHAFGPTWGYYVPWSGWLRDFSASPSQVLLWCYPITFGWAGVSLFFVISGFCIHFSFLRSGEFNSRQFFWRRFWRIYPAYMVALVLFAVASPVGIWSDVGSRQFWWHAFFAHNASSETFFGVNASFWSIAVEVQLYLLFPLLLWMRARIGLPTSMAVLFVVGCAWRISVMSLWPLEDHLVAAAWTSPLVTWFDWSLGAFVAERFASGRRAFERPAAWLVPLVVLLIASSLVKPLTVFSFTLASAVSAVVLDVTLHTEWRRGANIRFLAFVGTISYSLYLWHQPLLAPVVAAMAGWTGSSVVGWFAVVPAILTVSWLSFTALERPGIFVGRVLWTLIAGRASRQLFPASQSAQTNEVSAPLDVEKLAA